MNNKPVLNHIEIRNKGGTWISHSAWSNEPGGALGMFLAAAAEELNERAILAEIGKHSYPGRKVAQHIEKARKALRKAES